MLCASLGLTVGVLFASSSTDPCKHSCIQYDEKFYPVNRNPDQFNQNKCIPDDFETSWLPQASDAKRTMEMNAILYLRVSEFPDQPVIKKRNPFVGKGGPTSSQGSWLDSECGCCS